ncbi:hypothetical protein L195_g045424 [Trifolium pratense]|uniref:Uncharacterized protein n=1 Tax=Trifolium pratense TaxID=57577 RepID=A0A2K3MET2_TRIPR|nr:hypothetical protein L195_g045424 [Trifolium pratense]
MLTSAPGALVKDTQYSRRCCTTLTVDGMPRGSVEVVLMSKLLAGGFRSSCSGLVISQHNWLQFGDSIDWE